MSNEVKKYTLTIFGQTYILVSDEPEQYIMQAAQQVDTLMKTVSTKMPTASLEKLAMYVALRCALDCATIQTTCNTYTRSCEKMTALLTSLVQPEI